MEMQYPVPAARNQTPGSQIELMEQLIQGLYALGLKLEYCINLVDESPDQARAALDAAITNLGDEIDLLRRNMQTQHRLT